MAAKAPARTAAVVPRAHNRVMILVLLGVSVLFAFRMTMSYVKVWQRRLHGVTGWATVEARRDIHEYERVSHRLLVRLDTGTSVPLTLVEPSRVPSVGDRIEVRYDSRKPSNVEEVSRTLGARLLASVTEVIMLVFTLGSIATVVFLSFAAAKSL